MTPTQPPRRRGPRPPVRVDTSAGIILGGTLGGGGVAVVAYAGAANTAGALVAAALAVVGFLLAVAESDRVSDSDARKARDARRRACQKPAGRRD